MSDNENLPRRRAQSNGQAEPYETHLSENLVTMLAFKESMAPYVDQIVPENFEGELRVVAERVLAYWREYKRPPKLHTPDLLADILQGKNKSRAAIMRNIWFGMMQMNDSLDDRYVMDDLQRHGRTAQMKRYLVESAEHLTRGNLDMAQEAYAKGMEGVTPARRLVVRSADTMPQEDIEWTWWPFIPTGTVTCVLGEGGVGKSSLIDDIAARITVGGDLPQIDEDEVYQAPQGSVLILCKEDRLTARRIEVYGGDLSKVHLLGYENADGEFDDLERLDNAMHFLEQKIAEIGDVRMVKVDPVTDYSGEVDIYRDEQVRSRLLGPLNKLASKYDLAVVLVLHLNKKTDLAVKHRGMGSVAFRNAPRSVVIVAKDRDGHGYCGVDKDQFVPRKYLAEYNLTSSHVPHIPLVQWGSDWHDKDVDIEDIVKGKSRGQTQSASAWLAAELREGPVGAQDLKSRAFQAGHAWRTLLRAKQDIGVNSYRHGHAWYWELPGHDTFH
jgi:putative DNA primase/helicase